MKVWTILSLVLLISLVAGCGKSKSDPDYCEADSDCRSLAGMCEDYSCGEFNKCEITSRDDCCGNDICEDEEAWEAAHPSSGPPLLVVLTPC